MLHQQLKNAAKQTPRHISKLEKIIAEQQREIEGLKQQVTFLLQHLKLESNPKVTKLSDNRNSYFRTGIEDTKPNNKNLEGKHQGVANP